jgi:hypothetical protein
VFKVHFGKVTLKAFTKGEHVLRFEATVHNAATPCTGRVLLRFPALAARLRDVADRWLETIQYLDQAFVADETLDQLPTSAQLGRLSIGGFDLNKPHMRAMLGAAIACAQIPMGARLGDLVPRVPLRSGTLAATYGTRQAAYDLRSLRAKPFVRRASKSHRCQDPPDGLRTITALVVLREQVIEPILANVRTPHRALKPKTWTSLDDQYKTIRLAMQPHFADLGLVS